MNLSKFAERLSELLFENNLNPPAFAKQIGCGRATINRYLSGNYMPTVNMVVRMADYFNCSADFLLGLVEINYQSTFKACPPFKERLNYLCKNFGKTKYQLQKSTKIPESAIYNWQRGQTCPTIDNIIKMSEFFGCSVDFVLGRES